MTLDEYCHYKLNLISNETVFNSGPIVLNRNPAYKIIVGDKADPSNHCCVAVISKKGGTLYTISYVAGSI
jgi:hypothetical protein